MSQHIYRRVVSLNSDDSLGVVARLIPRNSRVLELGTATGYFGKVLVEDLECQVDGVEVDPVMAQEARGWYRRFLVGDLESESLLAHFARYYYDIVVCTDVLEHLRSPLPILRQVPMLLRPGGRFVTSVPNIAYAGVILELLSGDFRYRAEGLLDQTHLRFYTKQSFMRLLEEAGLVVERVQPIFLPIADSEFRYLLQDTYRDWLRWLPGHTESEAYQFVFVCSTAPDAAGRMRGMHRSRELNEAPGHSKRTSEGGGLLSQPESVLYDAVSRAVRCLNPVPPRQDHVRAQVRYDVIIPIFNAFEAVRKCLGRVLRHTERRHRIILADDASTDHRIHTLLAELASRHENVLHVSNAENVGFVQNVNRAMSLSNDNVVILNSDTLVTPYWLDRLDRCLGSDPNIGIACPLSNNATILSIPSINAVNPAPEEAELDEFAERISAASRRTYPRIPTAVGFCMAISRRALQRLGGFDPAFSPGYGEECDFSMRAWRAGIEIACCDDAYVVHVGGASFGLAESAGVWRAINEYVLDLRWPLYGTAIAAFCRENSLREIQERAYGVINRRPHDDRPHVLHVIHRFEARGGTELHTRAIVDGLAQRCRSTVVYPAPMAALWGDMGSSEEAEHLRLLRVRRENINASFTLLGLPGDLANEKVEGSFARLVSGGDYDIVHIQHLAGWGSLALPIIAKALGKRVVISLHDYFLLCPDYNLLLPNLEPCGKALAEGADRTCQQCLGAKYVGAAQASRSFLSEYLTARIAAVRGVLAAADLLLAPSEFLAGKYREAFGDIVSEKMRILPHGVAVEPRKRRATSKGLKVAALGAENPRKGLLLLAEAAGWTRAAGVEITVFARVPNELLAQVAGSGLIVRGRYRHEDLSRLLEGFDLVVIASVWEESFSLTLSEALAAGVPVLVPDAGAMGERVSDGANGFLYRRGSARALANRLRWLAKNPDQVLRVMETLKSGRVKTIAENAEEYLQVYRDLLSRPAGHTLTEQDTVAYGGAPESDCEGRGLMRRLLGFEEDRCGRTQENLGSKEYQVWVKKHAPGDRDSRLLACDSNGAGRKACRFHVIIGATRERAGNLLDTLLSIRSQTYANCRTTVIADFPRPGLEGLQSLDASWIENVQDTEPAQVLNREIIESDADWVLYLSAGDRLDPRFTYYCAAYVEQNPSWCFIYTDEDSLTQKGERYAPLFKPDVNPDLLLSTPYVASSWLIRRRELVDIGGFPPRNGMEGFELILAILDEFGTGSIGHVPHVLYHRLDCFPLETDPQIVREMACATLSDHFLRKGISARVRSHPRYGYYTIDYDYRQDAPVSIVVASRAWTSALNRCLGSVLQRTRYLKAEIILAVPQSVQASARSQASRLGERVRVLPVSGKANPARMNNAAAAAATGDYVLFLNDEAEVVEETWLNAMVMHGQRADIGVVGARLIFPSGHLFHAGLVLGLGALGVAGQHSKGAPLDDRGYMGRLSVVQNVSAVSSACMLVRKDLYIQLGGFDEQRFSVFHGEVDFCLRAIELGFKVVWGPFATVVQHGPGSLMSGVQGDDAEAALSAETDAMFDRWLPKLVRDPAYNPNLSLAVGDWRPEIQVDVPWDPNVRGRSRIAGFPYDEWGCGEYRVRAPLRALHEAGLADCAIMPSQESRRMPTLVEIERVQPDVLLLHNTLHDYQLRQLRLYRRYSKSFRVFGQDDLLEDLPAKNPYRQTNYRDIGSRLREAISLCDRLVVSTEPLATYYRGIAEEVRVVPNRLERARWEGPAAERRRGGKPRIGWAGGAQHQGDLEIIAPVVAETAKEADWVFFGMCPEALRPYAREFHPMVCFDDYPTRLAALNLDLAVAPLERNVFNEAKSNLRLLEYGVLGWPVVCTDILPYQDAPVARVPNEPAAWLRAVRERLHDLETAEREGALLRRWVLDHWMLEDHLQDWREALSP